MQTFTVTRLGCKVNQYESQQIRQLLEQLGLRAVKLNDKPDLVIVHSCCVTHTASAKSRQCLHKAQKTNPQAEFVLSGCLATSQTNEIGNLDKSIHLIGHNDNLAGKLSQIVSSSTEASAEKNQKPTTKSLTNKTSNDIKIKYKNGLPSQNGLQPLKSFSGQSRAFLKAQDGCDGFCTYCIVPKIRQKVHSKNIDSVLQEANLLVSAGHKEIVLTGIFLGAYGQDTVVRRKWDGGRENGLAKLVAKVAQVPGLARVRLSSLEPADVTDKLLDVFCEYDNIVPHLHLPLQSGSERILKKMGRQYTVADFRKTIARLKLRLDRPAITTDIIVGFPGESDQDFEATCELAREVGFCKMHVFSFSERKGTAAAKMQPKVETGVIKERSRMLRHLNEQLGAEFREQFAGQTVGIILEDSEQPKGRCERYFMVNLEGAERGQIGHLIFGKLRKNAVTADFISS